MERAEASGEDVASFLSCVWEGASPTWAEKFLKGWIKRTMASRIEPMKRVARMLEKHRALLLSWFRAGGVVSSGRVEGLNLKAKLTMRKSCGFLNVETLQTALYHTLGRLSDPKSPTDSAEESLKSH